MNCVDAAAQMPGQCIVLPCVKRTVPVWVHTSLRQLFMQKSGVSSSSSAITVTGTLAGDSQPQSGAKVPLASITLTVKASASSGEHADAIQLQSSSLTPVSDTAAILQAPPQHIDFAGSSASGITVQIMSQRLQGILVGVRQSPVFDFAPWAGTRSGAAWQSSSDQYVWIAHAEDDKAVFSCCMRSSHGSRLCWHHTRVYVNH